MLHSELILAVLIAIVKNDEKDERNGDDQPYLGGGGVGGVNLTLPWKPIIDMQLFFFFLISFMRKLAFLFLTATFTFLSHFSVFLFRSICGQLR